MKTKLSKTQIVIICIVTLIVIAICLTVVNAGLKAYNKIMTGETVIQVVDAKATATQQPTKVIVATSTAKSVATATQLPTIEVVQVTVEAVEPTVMVETVVVDPNARVFGYLNSTTVVDICASLNSLPVDPSSVPWPKTDRELNSQVIETLEGPAVLEWWDGAALEGVWQIKSGETMTLPLGLSGHYFPQTSDLAMVQSWPLEVCNYSKKPEHVAKLLYGDLVLNPITTMALGAQNSLYKP